MLRKFNQLLDALSEFLAQRKGLLPMTGIILILANLILQFLPILDWLTESDLLLHLGVILSIIGVLVAWAL